MLQREQLIGANFSFQHYPFQWGVKQLRLMGFQRMELWGIAPHLDLFHSDRARLSEIRSVLEDNGISVHCFTPEQVLYPVNIASGNDAYRGKSVECFLRAADLCAELGAKYLFLTPGRGYECESRECAWNHALQSLDKITAHAAKLGLRCLLEPLQRTESNIVNDVADLERLWKELNADHVDLVLDLVAMATAGDTVGGYFSRFGKRLAHVHVVDGTPAGHLAWGDGNLPLDAYLAEITQHSFQGTLTFEPFGNGSYALDPAAVWRQCLDAISPHFDSAE
ncbi:sugar phosphate isomerase/epimerase [Brucella pseudogrignonensis]|jgi:protein FrlC|uniref:sugar phosphate isomerase/epimerase family protein n=2 Tax=Brucella pseudogrignonensis TaxID=419475 RepID=UPI000DDB11A7|nr:sugar phosphate isomerase/epimerase family protein [Brucella pseudogrignonensis]KAB2689325.1 sugar phosphate isomerase/epimerase [Brucella pseudogrignonensis]MBO1027185.1 sugar phosphate isomerase/epimerase [Ochrobactrum sp. SD129]MCD4512372.1 sugar phosphate isomerase/epimerase [Brucella pseudogrignonensis]